VTDLLDPVLEAWRRNVAVFVNLVLNLPESGLDARDAGGKWTVAHHLAEIHGTHLYWLGRTAPEFAEGLEYLHTDDEDGQGFTPERDRDRIVVAYTKTADAVERVVRTRLEAGRPLDGVYAHPVNFLLHMMWHDAYHTGQSCSR
jgi:uncharacterized damage-inducible protein DinB